DEAALKEALKDELHEQPRMTMVPELSELRALLKYEPALGCVLSGAGPSILVLVAENNKELIKERLQEWLKQKEGRKPTILDVPVDREGMQIVQHEIVS